MVTRESSRIDVMNYNYMIEGSEIAYGEFGHSIKFIVENIEKSEAFSILGKRKSIWLLKNHPEFFI